jgi:hypothetical protein
MGFHKTGGYGGHRWPRLRAEASLAIANCALRAYTPLGIETALKRMVFGLGRHL